MTSHLHLRDVFLCQGLHLQATPSTKITSPSRQLSFRLLSFSVLLDLRRPPVKKKKIEEKKHPGAPVFPKPSLIETDGVHLKRSHGSVLFLVLTTHTDSELRWETHTPQMQTPSGVCMQIYT